MELKLKTDYFKPGDTYGAANYYMTDEKVMGNMLTVCVAELVEFVEAEKSTGVDYSASRQVIWDQIQALTIEIHSRKGLR